MTLGKFATGKINLSLAAQSAHVCSAGYYLSTAKVVRSFCNEKISQKLIFMSSIY